MTKKESIAKKILQMITKLNKSNLNLNEKIKLIANISK